MIYLDNAATSFPKPPQVVDAVVRYLTEVGGNPARSGHRMSTEAARIIYRTRESIARLVGLEDPLRIILTANATTAINIALQGLLKPGRHVITSSVEHNSVMRPLRQLESTGVEVTVVDCSREGYISVDAIAEAIQPNTDMVAICHGSNVLGSVQPIGEIGRLCREKEILFLVDAAQTLGVIDVDIERDCVDLLAFTGHKSLYGPQGTGGLVVSRTVKGSQFKPLVCGGTGSRSDSEIQPNFLPDVGESGTLNGPGLAGLGAGVEFVLAEGIEKIRKHEKALTEKLIKGLKAIPYVRVYGPKDSENRISIVSANIGGFDPSVFAYLLEDRYGILTRAGLHCSPAAHKTANTFPVGTVRFSLSYFTAEEEIDAVIDAMQEISGGKIISGDWNK
ncbi:MAG: aminotransferase class V-fold PLP-dependent enzyme [Armatimonadetes bacterium]|nr:aminotransferase class V-fold PLP-dependent enzyme [Armatimonadota bacterium]